MTGIALPHRTVLADSVYETVKALIMDHTLEPDAKINIDALTRLLEVSHTPVREALARLESDGLVVKLPLRGYSISPLLTRKEFEDLYELRLLLEPPSARRAAEAMTPEGRQALQEEMASCGEAPSGSHYEDYKAITAHDARLHDLIMALAGNAAIRLALERTHSHLHLFRLHYGSRIGSRALEEHQAIVTALVAGDPAEAESAMRTHLERARDRLSAAFE
ncbi:GntR family transcriptional regulator [Nonomuraea sp. NPDC000554]|uniref:GntR family transcriptional regulator n=1 Tax=Nonomuraea sp. NPDC000554 TaxID=3154259 RepID=UPI00331DFB2D